MPMMTSQALEGTSALSFATSRSFAAKITPMGRSRAAVTEVTKLDRPVAAPASGVLKPCLAR